MKRLLLSVIGGLALCSTAQAWENTTSQVYSNTGSVGIPPVIDAVDFINYGTFNVLTFMAQTWKTLRTRSSSPRSTASG